MDHPIIRPVSAVTTVKERCLIPVVLQMLNQKREARVLLSCDCHGLLEGLLGKVQQLQLKNSFDFLLLAGEVCHPRAAPYLAALRSGQKQLPIPVYFIDSSDMSPVLQKLHPEGKEIAPGMHWLGSQGVIKVKDVTIAYFTHNHWEGLPSEASIQKLIELCRGRRIDVLLTNSWSKQAKDVSKQSNAKAEDYIGRLANAINPHYHVAAGGSEFYRMQPYINSQGLLGHFISVAPFEEPPKGKYLFGLTITPSQEETPTTSTNFIENPYKSATSTEEGKREEGKVPTNFTVRSDKDNSETVVFFQGFPEWSRNSDITQFLQRWGQLRTIQVQKQLVKGSRCGIARFRSADSTAACLAASEKIIFHTKRIKFTRRTLKESRRVEDCWFCKAKGDESLIVYEGHHCYLSLEKGPLSRFHLQLIPYAHAETTGRLEVPQKEELQRIVKAVSGHYQQEGFEVVVYERYLPLSEAINHAVLHIIPVKQQQLVKKFEDLNKSDNLGFKPQGDDSRKTQHFIRVEVNGRAWVKEVQRKERVQADFMRIVLSQLLGNARLSNWKQCVREQQEVAEVKGEVAASLRKIGVIAQQL